MSVSLIDGHIDRNEQKMSDIEIIKAFYCCEINCDCLGCPKLDSTEGCNGVATETLDLINRQKAEIERLKQNLEEAHIDIKEHQAHIGNLKKLIDKIEDHINPLPFETDYDKAIRQAKTEAVKEFAERLKQHYIKDKRYDRPNAHTLIAFLFNVIDNLVKEMVGEDNA